MTKQYTDLNRSSNQLDFLLYLEDTDVLTINKSILKDHKEGLIDFMNQLIVQWKELQEFEFTEVQKRMSKDEITK